VNALNVTAITDLILAAEGLFLAGMLAQMPKARFSAAWFWSGAMALLGLAALMGGIDHGIFEAQGMPRYVIQRANWIVVGLLTFSVLMTTSAQFFSRKIFTPVLLFGMVQFAAYTAAVILASSFLVVIVNYAPVMILWLAMNIAGLRNGTGSRDMVAGTLILFCATAIQALKVDVFSPVDHNGLYHLVSMAGIVFMYRGGRHLRAMPLE
jgi:hypothetical protein